MIVMPSNSRGIVTGYLCGKFDGRMGHLYSPEGLSGRLYDWLPFALDNGKYACWAADRAWSEDGYKKMLDAVASMGGSALWALVPDAVGDRDETLRLFDRHAPLVASYGWPIAIAVQDGMTPADIPSDAQVVFVGGTTEWKWGPEGLPVFASAFDRVHVGRVNTNGKLWECHEAGAESCDGTGWFRGDQKQLAGLVSYLERSSAGMGNQRGEKLWA